MKKLILQSLLFICIALAMIAGLVFYSNRVVNTKARFSLKPNIDKIVLGHSHAEVAYNDSLIPGLQNFGHSGECYFYTYYKIIPLLEKNPAIKTVFIEFTNNYFEDPDNSLIWGSEYINYQYPRSAPFFDMQGNLSLLKHNPMAFLNVQSRVVKQNLGLIQSSNYEYGRITGKYLHLVRDKTDSLLAVGYDKKNSAFSAPEQNLGYLRKLVDYCRNSGRNIYLLRTPIHSRNPGLKYEDHFQKARTERFADVDFLDFKNFPLLNSEFGDLEHLNHKGAKKFSLFFDQLLSSGLLQRDNKQAMIDSLQHHW